MNKVPKPTPPPPEIFDKSSGPFSHGDAFALFVGFIILFGWIPIFIYKYTVPK